MEIIPFIEFIKEDKSRYPLASSKGYIDLNDDFLIGDSGGFLMNWNFKFVDTWKFSRVADFYVKADKYTDLPKGTHTYKRFWDEEEDKRRRGAVENCKLLFKDVDKYENALTDKDRAALLQPCRITGDHYNYLNYSRIMRTPTKEEREDLIKRGFIKLKHIEGFPRFWDGDYWNFKIDEFIASNSYHLTKAKARGKGYSYKRGSQAANTLNLNRKVVVVLGAYLIDYLTDPGATADMAKTNLDWLENNTAWKRGYLSEPLTEIELGYKEQSKGNIKFGYRSKLLSVTFKNNASAAIGKRAIEIDIEESGKCPNLLEILDVTTSSTEVGSENVGTIRVYGTTGVKEADWIPFSKCYYTPSMYDMLPMENIWDKGARRNVCGFFHPQILNFEPFIDTDGNSMLLEALEFDIKDKEQKKQDLPSPKFLAYRGQRANSPQEAFLTSSENIFSSNELSDHILRVMHDPELKFYRDGMFVANDKGIVFKSNTVLLNEGKEVHPYIESVPIREDEDPYGCIRIFYDPSMFMVDGVIPNDLLYIAADPVDKDKDKKDFDVRNSLNSFGVFTYPNNLGFPSDVLVASFAGRPPDTSDANKILSLMSMAYNAKILAEVDRGKIVADFRRWGMLRLLYTDPTDILNEKITKQSSKRYGIIIGEGDNKADGILYVKEWLYTPVSKNEDGTVTYRLHYMYDLPTLLEINQYKEGVNLDRLSMLIVAMFQRHAYRTQRKQPVTPKRVSVFNEIGLYKIK